MRQRVFDFSLSRGQPADRVTGKALSRSQAAAGIVTLLAMMVAFGLANSPWYDAYWLVHHLPVVLKVGSFVIDKPLILWINDGLMVFFFLFIALELKREILQGQLSRPVQLAAPAFAALGGMLVPALIYVGFNIGDTFAMRGWAIPTATDAVLALTILTLLGDRVPTSLKVFLTALAIFDDLGAILIIALFYTDQISLVSLGLAGTGIVLLGLLNRFEVTGRAPYIIVGVLLWLAVLKSGVHATLAGVAIGLAIPLSASRGGRVYSPLTQAVYELHPWVALGVVPVFAFFNAGIPLSEAALGTLFESSSLGIVLGLFLGKQIGIFGATWLAVRFGLARLPHAANWKQVYGVALVAGVGFTMSLFIAGLAFGDPEMFRNARLSVVLGSILSAVAAVLILWLANGVPNKLLRGREEDG
jgi:NhaA family Na+:H+ antiporter